MKKNIVAVLGCTVCLAVSSPVLAQSAAPPAAEKNKMDEVVCEKSEVVGSRVATKKVCKTRAEWAEMRRTDRQAIDKAQTNLGIDGK